MLRRGDTPSPWFSSKVFNRYGLSMDFFFVGVCALQFLVGCLGVCLSSGAGFCRFSLWPSRSIVLTEAKCGGSSAAASPPLGMTNLWQSTCDGQICGAIRLCRLPTSRWVIGLN